MANMTLQEGASGADVVKSVVSDIQSLFGDDKQFLRRVAYVESKDGTDPNTYRSGYCGGIWQVDVAGFNDTQATGSHPKLVAKYEKIKDRFGIDWPKVEWSDLKKPLYSGLAARLFLLNIPASIPSDIPGQAKYWKDHYNKTGKGTVEKFIKDVEAL